MPIDYEGNALKAFGPKVGESKIIHIRSSVKVEDPSKTSEENFRSKVKNWGYRFELTLTNGRIFTLNNWKVFFAFKEPANAELDEKGVKVPVQDGDKIQIDHVAERVYKVNIIEKGTGIGVTVEDTEKLAYDNAKAVEAGQTVAPVETPAVVATPPAATPPAVTPPVATPPVATPPPAVTPPVTPPVAPPVATPPAVTTVSKETKPAGEEPKLDLPF